MIKHFFSDLENWFKSQDYKCAYLIRDKEQILTAFKDTVPTSILGIEYTKNLIHIGLFFEYRNDPASLGFSDFTDRIEIDIVTAKIQNLEKDIYDESQIPYLDELMRRREYFSNPHLILQNYAQMFEYDLIISQTEI